MKSGFSLLEITIVIGIFLVVFFVSVNIFSNFYRSQLLEAEVAKAVSIIQETRSKTLSSKNFSEYGAYFEQEKITSFTGTVYASSSPDNKEYIISNSVEIYDIILNGGGQDLFFKKLTGETDKYGSVGFRLKNDFSKTKKIIISASGMVSAD